MSAPAPGEGGSTSSGAPPANSGDANEPNAAAAAAAAAEGDNLDDVFDEAEALSAIEGLSAAAIQQRTQMINSDLRVYQSECTSLKHDVEVRKRDIADNTEKIKMNRQLPHLVATVAEVMKYSELDDEIPDESVGGAVEEVTEGDDYWAVLKTTSRQTIFLPMIGLVDAKDLSPTDLVGVNKDSYLVLDKLPAEYDSRAQAMEVDERPTDSYADIGGLDKQIQELIEAIVLPVTHKERFDAIGIQPPKGVLLHGPPGTGKTLLARACAAATKATFLKLAGPSLVQMYIGDGAKIIRDAFSLARSKSPAVIFIDEIDAVGTKRSGGGEHSGVREVQRTMLELLNQLDGFTSDTTVKVIAATNRPDVLDPALMRSGRLDRKIELPHPNEDARGRILQIHARKMTYNKEEINFGELARSTDDFNAAQLKAVAVEAGMEALRRGGTKLSHEDFVAGIGVVAAKKKCDLNYYA